MNIPQAITAFSQSDKIKSEILCVSQSIEILSGMPEPEKRGAERIIRANIAMIANEVIVARRLTGDSGSWDEIVKNIDMAMVMCNSGVLQEALFHLTRALTQITGIAQRSMTLLKEQQLI